MGKDVEAVAKLLHAY